MALDLSNYYDSVKRTSENLEDIGHDVGTAIAHGGHKLKRHKAEQRAQGKKLGLLGFGLMPKWFGQSGYTAKAPQSYSQWQMDYGTLTDPEKQPGVYNEGIEDYQKWLGDQYGGLWDVDSTADPTATRDVNPQKGTLLGTYGLRGGDETHPVRPGWVKTADLFTEHLAKSPLATGDTADDISNLKKALDAKGVTDREKALLIKDFTEKYPEAYKEWSTDPNVIRSWGTSTTARPGLLQWMIPGGV